MDPNTNASAPTAFSAVRHWDGCFYNPTAALWRWVLSHSGAASRAAARSLCGLRCPDERAGDPAFDLRGDLVHIETGFGQELLRIVRLIHAPRFDVDRLEAGLGEVAAVVVLVMGAGDAADRQLHDLD